MMNLANHQYLSTAKDTYVQEETKILATEETQA